MKTLEGLNKVQIIKVIKRKYDDIRKSVRTH
jgi:hypothetical protein